MSITRGHRLKQDGDPHPVLFYAPHDNLGEFSNFSDHEIWLPHPFGPSMINYETGEHRYQAMKAKTAEQHDYVADSMGPAEAKMRGRTVDLRDHWGDTDQDYCYLVMCEVVLVKALQYPEILASLMLTGNHMIYEDSPTDDIWGWRFQSSYSGRNLLGLAWMHARGILSY